jgi:hypothetical protein
VRDDRHYRRKNKREEHIRSIDQSVFLEKKKIGSRVQSSCYLEPAHPGIPCLIQGYPLKRKRLVRGFRALDTWNLHIQGYPV